MAGESRVTTDHETIRKWAEARGGKPATVKRTENDEGVGVLRIDFPGYSGTSSLEEITWDEFFAKLDEKQLAFLYQDTTSSGEESRFFKLVSRNTAEHIDEEKSHSHKSGEKSSSKSDEQTHKADEKPQSHKASAHKTDEKAHKANEKTQSHKSDEQTHKTHKTSEKEKAHSHKADAKSSRESDEQTHKAHTTDEKEKAGK
jgi:hypothetical protein